ncbi:MAG: hypothetical protein OXI38_12045 [Bacteroidota bacterium]|nr:hypothetical protein [Bacteroidota bacterium]
MASCRTFRGRSRYHPARSILGRICSRLIEDERRAEAWYLIAASTIAVLCMIAVMAITSAGEAQGAEGLLFWPWAVFGLIMAICLVGFEAGVEVSADTDGLTIRQGGRSHRVKFAAVDCSQIVSALVYYRNYAQYTDTRCFMARIPEDVLVLTIADQHVAIGIGPSVHARLAQLIQQRLGQRVHPGVSRQVEYGV